jgi:hypothetical protein
LEQHWDSLSAQTKVKNLVPQLASDLDSLSALSEQSMASLLVTSELMTVPNSEPQLASDLDSLSALSEQAMASLLVKSELMTVPNSEPQLAFDSARLKDSHSKPKLEQHWDSLLAQMKVQNSVPQLASGLDSLLALSEQSMGSLLVTSGLMKVPHSEP